MHKRRALIVIGAIILIVLAAVGGGFAAKLITERQHAAKPSDVVPVVPVKTALSCVEKLPASVLIGQKIMAAGYSDQLVSSKPAFTENGIGGIIIMDETPAETIADFIQGFTIAPTVAVDQEGGTVQRYTSEGRVPGAAEMAADYTPGQAYQRYLTDAQYLKTIGITTNFAPVIDVIGRQPSPLPDRMYSSEPSVVVQYATQMINASQKAGVTPVIKHFPGLGSASGNTDNGSATTDPLAVLQTRDLIPYQQLADLKPDAMVSNAIVPGLTDGQPAVWSAAAASLLRGYGYQNSVIYTDSLTAKAVPGSIEDAAVKAWQADVDIALIVQQHQDTTTLATLFQSIIARASAALQDGELNTQSFSESVVRILQRKSIDPCSIAN